MYLHLSDILDGFKKGKVERDFLGELVKEKGCDTEDVATLDSEGLGDLVQWNKVKYSDWEGWDPEEGRRDQKVPNRVIEQIKATLIAKPENFQVEKYGSGWCKWISFLSNQDPTCSTKWFEATYKDPFLKEKSYDEVIPKLNATAISKLATTILDNPPRLRMMLLKNDHLPDIYFPKALAGFSQVKEWEIAEGVQKRLKEVHLATMQTIAQMRVLYSLSSKYYPHFTKEYIGSLVMAGMYTHKDVIEKIRSKQKEASWI